jgi:hypothetical protein
MEGSPVAGHRFSHAYTGDHFAVVSLKERLTVPYGSFSNVVMTREWNPEERDVLTYKYYLSGIGEARDVTLTAILAVDIVGFSRLTGRRGGPHACEPASCY